MYAACGADRDVARVRRLLRTKGVRPSYDGPLTSRTVAGADRVGVRCRQPGRPGRHQPRGRRKLYLPPHTVNSYLRHVFTRLGIQSRVELARLAAERDASA